MYGFDPYTYRNDVMPIVAAIVLPADRIEALWAAGKHLGELGRTSPESLGGRDLRRWHLQRRRDHEVRSGVVRRGPGILGGGADLAPLP